ncbi:hypothetical protein SCLARK_00916 [Spiroplasma clarkii]|uniref:hypothetical protein n=1 Tax=Spiroplasma clarkii TaxID=2139 RepID=UPI000B55E40C|nr:hypothetical protein [Spiroplasma clarkii]ARU91524.1 hypothetical protein SCLARK_00916 [Spiroplasma clarkii]
MYELYKFEISWVFNQAQSVSKGVLAFLLNSINEERAISFSAPEPKLEKLTGVWFS